ncbi:MAG: tyrosine-type recombinase/integrase [Chloroflexi bacterium]|nr:tyrosine-type recombinase/integrase [Chloroflexota bacterium]
MKAYLEPDDIRQLEQATTCLRDGLLIALLFHEGIRISEALGLEVKDVDLKVGTITILHLKSRLKLNCSQCGTNLGRSHVFCPRCGARIDKPSATEQARRRVRTLPVDTDTLQRLKEYIERGGPVKKGDKLLLFAINRHRSWQIVRDCAQRAGLPKLVNPETGKVHNVSPHKLRDAFAVLAVKRNDSGDGLRLLQQHLGHSSFDTTARYRKISGDEHREWYQQLWRKSDV